MILEIDRLYTIISTVDLYSLEDVAKYLRAIWNFCHIVKNQSIINLDKSIFCTVLYDVSTKGI
jgi:hypothetical protein